MHLNTIYKTESKAFQYHGLLWSLLFIFKLLPFYGPNLKKNPVQYVPLQY